MSESRQLSETSATSATLQNTNQSAAPEQPVSRANKKKKSRQKKQQMKQNLQIPEISDNEKIEALSEAIIDFEENEDTSDEAYLIIEKLAKKYVDIINRADMHGYTPLSSAADVGDIKLIDILINAGANVNASDNIGYSPLNRALLNNDKECAKHLIRKHNANIRLNHGNGDALYNAMLVSNVSMMKFLVGLMQQKAEPSDKASFDNALKRAIIEKYAEAAYFLLRVLHPDIHFNIPIKCIKEENSDKSAVGFILNLYLLNCPMGDIKELLSSVKNDDLSPEVINCVARKLFSCTNILRSELLSRIKFINLIVFVDVMQSNSADYSSVDEMKKGVEYKAMLTNKYADVVGYYDAEFLKLLKIEIRQLHSSNNYDDAIKYYLFSVLNTIICTKLRKLFNSQALLVSDIEKLNVKSEHFKPLVTSLSSTVNSFDNLINLICCFDSDVHDVVKVHCQLKSKLSELYKKHERYEEQSLRLKEEERKRKELQAIKRLQIQQQKQSRKSSMQYKQEMKAKEEDAARKVKEEEVVRRAKEEEVALKAKEEEAAQRAKEQEIARKVEEEKVARRVKKAAARKAKEEEVTRKEKEEAAHKPKEEIEPKIKEEVESKESEIAKALRLKREAALKPVLNIIANYNLGMLPSLFLHAFQSVRGASCYLGGGACVALIRFAKEKRSLFGLSDFDFVGVCKDMSKLQELKYKKKEGLADLYIGKAGYRIEYMNYAEGEFHLYDNALNCDFYVCSLVMDELGNVYDPTGQGLADLLSNKLRTIDDPYESLTSQPVRLLRAIRYISQGFVPDLALEEVLQNWDMDKIKLNLNVMSFLRLKLKYYLQNDHDGAYRAALKKYGLWEKFELHKSFPENSAALNGLFTQSQFKQNVQDGYSQGQIFDMLK